MHPPVGLSLPTFPRILNVPLKGIHKMTQKGPSHRIGHPTMLLFVISTTLIGHTLTFG